VRIGLPGTGATVDHVVGQAQRAENDGFASLWYTSAVAGDSLLAIALAGRATSSIELGTAVMQTYPCHPVLQATRAAAVGAAIGSSGRFTLGVGPSHRPIIEGMFGLAYDTPGRHTEEYVQILTGLLDGEAVRFEGDEFRVNAGPLPLAGRVRVLVSALAPRLLRVAGTFADGTVLWMANATAVAQHVTPRITEAATQAGRPAPRIVAGLPVAVHDDVAEARAVAAHLFAVYAGLPNYQRILAHGGVSSPAEAVIVGNEEAVRSQIVALFDAGATDVWAAPFPVGEDKSASRTRTRALLMDLAQS
jgi:F420-dependent oxidoreductase-like protein